MFQLLHILTVILVAIAMALSLAHVLELPGKLRLDRDTYLKGADNLLSGVHHWRHQRTTGCARSADAVVHDANRNSCILADANGIHRELGLMHLIFWLMMT